MWVIRTNSSAVASGPEGWRPAADGWTLHRVVGALETCSDDFHAQWGARSKRYAYVVHTTNFRPPWGEAYGHWIPQPLDLESVRAAAQVLRGEHDFSSLANAGSPRKSNVRNIRSIHVLARSFFAKVFVRKINIVAFSV